MKTFIKVITFLLSFSPLFAQTQYRFNINNINMPIDNKGILGDVYGIPGGQGGKYNDIPFLFSGGFWLSGYNADSLWANAQASASRIENYIPGKVGGNPNDPNNRIYIVDKNDNPFGTSWQDWAEAVALGAEFYDGNNDGIYDPIDLNGNNIWDLNEDKPDIIGDRVAWSVYNDIDTNSYHIFPIGNHSQGIELHQTIFGYKSESSTQLRDVIFIRYKIINTGLKNSILDSVFFTAWAYADLADNYDDDLIGCDTLIKSGYVYNSQADPIFGESVPAFFIKYSSGSSKLHSGCYIYG